MRALLLAVMLVFMAGTVRAQDVSAADGTAIRGVISGQIESFQRDDAPGAFAFASPGIQRMFSTPERFLGMVQEAYPSVHHPRSVEFGGLSQEDGRIVQQVELIGPDGKPQLALYEMERGSDGIWRIAGCSLVRSPRIGV